MNKKSHTLFTTLLVSFVLFGCSSNNTSAENKVSQNITNEIKSEITDKTTNETINETTSESTSEVITDVTDNTNSDADVETNGSIVIYFSRTNNTKKVAEYIEELTNSESYEILAKVPYTDEDIKYYTNCRADKEQADPTARPEIGSETIDLTNYDIIYFGYPIWHGQAPKIMYTFVESYDLSNKIIIPFCTSASSPIGSSATNLSKLDNNAKWLDGKRFSQNATKDEIKSWIDFLN